MLIMFPLNIKVKYPINTTSVYKILNKQCAKKKKKKKKNKRRSKE